MRDHMFRKIKLLMHVLNLENEQLGLAPWFNVDLAPPNIHMNRRILLL